MFAYDIQGQSFEKLNSEDGESLASVLESSVNFPEEIDEGQLIKLAGIWQMEHDKNRFFFTGG